MNLRVRLNRRTSRVELTGENPTLSELADHIRQTLLPAHGLSADTHFRLSLNGTEPLPDDGQTLSSCSVVSGDLICVILPEHVSAASSSTEPTPNNLTTPNSATRHVQTPNTAPRQIQTSPQTQPTASASGNEPGPSSRPSLVSDSGPSSSTGSSLVSDSDSSTSLVSDSDQAGPRWEPMLCSEAEDGQAPLSLELLYHGAHITSPSDAVIVVGHLLMLETGFTSEGCELSSVDMPSGWRAAGGVYKLKYSHALCENSLATVAAVSTGPALVINATLKVNEKACAVGKLCVTPSSFVTNEWPGEHAAAAFKDLKKLSRMFKDTLAYPLIAAAREAMALPVAFGLPALPPELLLRVLRLLDVQSLSRLSTASRHFLNATIDSTLWKHLFLRDFRDPGARNRSRDTNWKELYKKHFKLCRERHRLRHHRSIPPYPSPNPFGPLPVFDPVFEPIVPGIIGGAYDQRPALPRVLLPRPRHDVFRPFRTYTPRSGGRDRGFI